MLGSHIYTLLALISSTLRSRNQQEQDGPILAKKEEEEEEFIQNQRS